MQRKPQIRSWPKKFRDAADGIKLGTSGQSSFRVHFFMAGLVILAAIVFGASRIEWCLLLLCITIVLAAEMFNSAIERLAAAITRDHDLRIAGALHIGSAAVLVASTGAAAVGTVIFIHRLLILLGWWNAAMP